MKNLIKILSIICFLLSYITSTDAQVVSVKLLGDFKEDWEKHWIARNLTQLPSRYQNETDLSENPTRYEVAHDKDDMVLKVESSESVSVLWHPIGIHPLKFGRIKWRWKVEKSLTKNKKETHKVGDDYAARLFLVFEPHLVSWKMRAICYVWAGNQPVGSVYKNPYASSVATLVVESGNKRAGKWISEGRNFVADYLKVFGTAPEMVSAVAIMVDTDNTLSRATAWFDDIILELWEPKLKTDETPIKRFDIKL